MALPSPSFYSTGDVEETYHDFVSCEAGAYTPDATGWKVRLWNDKGGILESDNMTSVKISVRDADGGTDELWTQQHWIQIKSSSGSTGVVDDDMTVFQAVGKNKELSLGDIPYDEYRTLYVRCYPPTDAIEGDVDFQLRVTYQQPQTSICKWITGLRGNGVVATTGDPFAMSTGSTGGEIDYKAGPGYALINNNEIYYGSSGIIDISEFTTGSGTYAIYLNESGAFGMTTGDVDDNQLELYEATISSGTCTTPPTDKRVYLAGLQAGTTGARPSTPDLGDLYLDITNGIIYGAKTAGNWTNVGSGTFLNLTDTPSDYSGDANKILNVNASSGAVEFTSATGFALDGFGTPTTGTALNATTGKHGLLPILSGSSGEYLNGDGSFVVPQASDIEVSEIGTATYDDVQDWINNIQSGGIISGGTIADDSSGGITISSGKGFIKSTTGDLGAVESFDWSAGTIVSTGLTDASANYIYMDYNAGTPQILATADRTTIRLQDQFTMGRVYKSSGELHILNTGVKIYNFSRREHERLVAVRNFERASGGVITESAGTARALESTIGNFYLGLNRVTTTAKDTSTGGSHYFTSWYYINSAWTSSTGQQQIDNTNYNDTSTTGLRALTANRYGVHWVYVHFDSDIQTVYGQGDYTLTQAEMAAIPDSLPPAVNDFGTLVAKIILQQGSTGFTSIATAYKTLFPVSSPADHNDLGGLDTADYQHLTQAEHDEITQWAGAVTLSTGGAINLVTFSTGGTVNIPSGQEYQINGTKLTASDVGALESSGAFTAGRLTEISTTGGVLKESPFAVTTGDVFDFGAHSAVFTEQAIGTTTGTASIDWNNGLKALFTRSTGANGAVTFSFTVPVKSANLMLTIRGSAAGSTGTVTWPAIKWDGGSAPSLGSGASDINVVSFYYSTGLTSYLGASSTGTFSS